MRILKNYYIANINSLGFTGEFDTLDRPRFSEFDRNTTMFFNSEDLALNYIEGHEQFAGETVFIDSFYVVIND